MPSHLIQVTIAHFDSVFQGPNGDYPSVLEALEGVSAEQALWKPSPTQNSIWQIVEHLIASKEWQIGMIKGENPASPKWVEPGGDEGAWQATLDRLNGLTRTSSARWKPSRRPTCWTCLIRSWERPCWSSSSPPVLPTRRTTAARSTISKGSRKTTDRYQHSLRPSRYRWGMSGLNVSACASGWRPSFGDGRPSIPPRDPGPICKPPRLEHPFIHEGYHSCSWTLAFPNY